MHATRRISLYSRSLQVNKLYKSHTPLTRFPVYNVDAKRYTSTEHHQRFNALHTAAQLGDVDMARGLLERGGININGVSETYLNTPLAAAVERGSRELVRNLIVNGADVNSWMKEDGSTLLLDAVERGYDDIVFLLIQHGAKLNISNKRGVTPLISAIQHGRLGVVQSLLKEGAKVSAIGSGDYPLNVAAREGETEIARELVKYGATFQSALIAPTNQNTPRRTPGNQRVIQQDIVHGAQTPCHLAAEHGHADTLLYLSQLPHASALTQRATDGMTPLHLACASGHADVVRVLVRELGADVNTHDQRGRSALYHAVRAHCGSCVRELLARGARVDAPAFSVARDQGNKAIIGLLQNKM